MSVMSCALVIGYWLLTNWCIVTGFVFVVCCGCGDLWGVVVLFPRLVLLRIIFGLCNVGLLLMVY